MISDEMDYESDSGVTNKRRSSCCSEFEAQICCSYVISILSSLLIAGGFYLTILKWDHLWLILPIVGSILIFIGACMYYSGQMDLRRRRRRRNDKTMAAESHGLGRRHRRRSNKDRGQSGGSGIGGDNLISSGLNDGRSLSQLSINMIPQYFSNSDLGGSLSGPASNLPYSQILRVNGQSFLILPLTGDQASSPSTNTNPNDTAISLQNLMVKMPSKSDQQSKPEASDIYKKLEELPKRFNNKDYTTYTMEDCLPSSSSVPHDERNVIGLDNRSTGMTNFNRESDPGSHSEYRFISNYFCAPGTSSSQHNNTPIITTQSQPEAQTSRVVNGKGSIRMMGQSSGGHAGSQSRITNHRSSLIQHPVSSASSIGQASSSSSSSSFRRPLLRRDTFNKDKPSVTIVKSTANQSDSLHAQTTVIADPSISSVEASSRSNANNKRIENGNNRSVSNSLRLLSSQPGSCNSYSTSEVLVLTQSNLSPNPNTSSSSSPTSSSSSSSSNNIPNSMIPGDSLLPDRHRRTMNTDNSDETFIVMCGGNGSSTDSDNLNFDDNLIEPGSATPPPSYEEVLSVDTVGGPNGTCNSIAFDTL